MGQGIGSLKHRAGVDVPVSTMHFLISTDARSGMPEQRRHDREDAPVELKDARINFCCQSSVTQRGVVEPIDILSYK